MICYYRSINLSHLHTQFVSIFSSLVTVKPNDQIFVSQTGQENVIDFLISSIHNACNSISNIGFIPEELLKSCSIIFPVQPQVFSFYFSSFRCWIIYK